MKKTLPLILFISLAMLFLGTPQRTLAQRGGGHGGGGGFHGGGGGFHGGGFSGGFHGGGFAGGSTFRGSGGFHGGSAFRARTGFRGGVGFHGGAFHGGFRGTGFHGGWGWRGRGWGWGGWGWGGWGWGWGLGWSWAWPYWGWPGYAYYPYGYWAAPPYDPSYDPSYDPNADPNDAPPPPNYRQPNNRQLNPLPPNMAPRPNDSNRPQATAPNSGISSPNRPPQENAPRVATASYRLTAPSRASSAMLVTTSDGKAARAAVPLRPEVRNAMNHLREMPPFAREREISVGRYSHFSPEERQLLKDADK